ncbi:MAG: hypothetical protein LH615_04470, partial [Ferruginibacter sp.]|nr:hypothetical protein [Ferruginibacter sp.]
MESNSKVLETDFSPSERQDVVFQPNKEAAILNFSGKCILLFYSFWGKDKKNHISSSTIYLAFINMVDYLIFLHIVI